MGEKQTQSDKFKEAVGEHEADEDEKHWEERLRKIAKTAHAPAPPSADPVVKKAAKQKPDADAGG